MRFILSYASFSLFCMIPNLWEAIKEAERDRFSLDGWLAPSSDHLREGWRLFNRSFESRVQSLILQLISSHLWPRQRVSGRPLVCSGHSWEVRDHSWRANIHTQTLLTGRHHAHSPSRSITHPNTHRSPGHGCRKTTSAPHTATRRLVREGVTADHSHPLTKTPPPPWKYH